jgi:hypothetical protein
MRQVLTVLLVAGLAWFGWRFYGYFNQKMAENTPPAPGTVQTAPGKLPGMPAELETSLEAARRGGVESLRNWLGQHWQEVHDPRLADIEMDYVVLAGRSNPAEARRVLDGLRERLRPASPAYKRFQQLAKAYQ